VRGRSGLQRRHLRRCMRGRRLSARTELRDGRVRRGSVRQRDVHRQRPGLSRGNVRRCVHGRVVRDGPALSQRRVRGRSLRGRRLWNDSALRGGHVRRDPGRCGSCDADGLGRERLGRARRPAEQRRLRLPRRLSRIERGPVGARRARARDRFAPPPRLISTGVPGVPGRHNYVESAPLGILSRA